MVTPTKKKIITIKIDPSTKKRLDELKIHPRQSYNEAINDLIEKVKKHRK